MNIIKYILTYLTNDKCRNIPYAETHRYNMYKEFFAYLENLGYSLQQKDKTYFKEYFDWILNTIEKELDYSSS